MKVAFLTIIAIIFFSACSTSNRAVAMNEYNPNINTNTAAVAVITPEMIKEVKARRAKYIKEYGNIDL